MHLGPRTPSGSDALREAAEKIRARELLSDEQIKKLQSASAPKHTPKGEGSAPDEPRKRSLPQFVKRLGWNGVWKLLILILLSLISFQLFKTAPNSEPEQPSRIRR